jgi:hypothetical protein
VHSARHADAPLGTFVSRPVNYVFVPRNPAAHVHEAGRPPGEDAHATARSTELARVAARYV